MGQLDHTMRNQIRHYFWVCLWDCFWMRLAFEWVTQKSRCPSALWRCLVAQSIKGLNRTKGREKRNQFILLPAWLLELGHQSPALGLGWHHCLAWVFGLQTADYETSQLPSLCEPVPHNKSHVSLSLYLFVYVYTLLILFLWRTLTNTSTKGHIFYTYP